MISPLNSLSRALSADLGMWNWQGASGSWYAHTIYPIDAIPDWVRACNYIFAGPRADGLKSPYYIGESGEFDVRLGNHEKLAPAIRLGATECHIHLGARESKQLRLDVETDLRNGHPTPLNQQGCALAGLAGITEPGLFPTGLMNDFGSPAKNALADAVEGLASPSFNNFLAELSKWKS